MSTSSTLFEFTDYYGFAEALAEVTADLAARVEAENAAAREAVRSRMSVVDRAPDSELRALLRSARPAGRALAA
ncbi:MAG: hypothetical protein LC777_02350 [Actinobacteria bacterium]|nr:hypothetical protein [Actinomycetota bacterium]